MEIDFNINSWVKVKLNKTGIDELRRIHNNTFFNTSRRKAFVPPKVDEDGYSKFQLWALMGDLGHLCYPEYESPFDTNIKLIV